jgi:hypothetical protein
MELRALPHTPVPLIMTFMGKCDVLGMTTVLAAVWSPLALLSSSSQGRKEGRVEKQRR